MAEQLHQLASEIEAALISEYGPVLSGATLSKCLGYPSVIAMRQSISRGTAPDIIFSIPKRSGRFALARDIAIWLAKQRLGESYDTQQGGC